MIEIVFFDAGDTLLYVSSGRRPRELAAARSLGLDVSEEDVERAAARAGRLFDEAPRPIAPTADAELAFWQRYYETFLEALGVPDPERRLRDALHRAAWWVPHTHLFGDVRPTLEGLRRLGVRMGVISNAFASMQEALDHLGLVSYFDTITISDVVGINKPDPGIYTNALEAAGVRASEAVFVDDLVENVQAADRLGMHGLLIDRRDRHREAPVRRIRDLEAVVAFVEDSRPVAE